MRLINEFLDHLMTNAQKLRDDAAMEGSHSDGGAERIEREVHVYRSALKGLLPFDWGFTYGSFLKQADLEADPDYKEFLRLQKKFSDDQ